MSTKTAILPNATSAVPMSLEKSGVADLLQRYSSGPIQFAGTDDALYVRRRDTLLTQGDHYMHLADLTSYIHAQDRLGELYSNPGEWARKAMLNVGSSGKFSSDRTIHEYATEIWKAEPCPIL